MNTNQYPGKFILVVGAAGSGKGVLVRHAKEAHPEIVFPISVTTRKARPQEIHGTHYHFLPKEEFESRAATGEFLEWANIDGCLYGTRKSDVLEVLETGKLALKEMDVQGVRQTLSVLPRENVVTVFVDAGDWNTLARRVQGRAPISPEELESRRARYEYEKEFKSEANYVVENRDGKFKEADAAFEAIIRKFLPSA